MYSNNWNRLCCIVLLILPMLAMTSNLVAGLRTDGGWDSGGGQVFRYENNPWYLENTKTVRVCVLIDEANFGISKAEASRQVLEALFDWTDTLIKNPDTYYSSGELEPYGQVRLGTQQFVLESCDDDTDLRFQFGVLSEYQKTKYFDDPRNYVARAVRVYYNSIHMTSKGFIYVAPTKGPLSPSMPKVASDAWTMVDGKALATVLHHELGHVFGLRHSIGLMSEELPTLMMSEKTKAISKNSKIWQKWRPAAMFRPRPVTDNQGCGNDSPVRDKSIFGIDSKSPCTRVRLDVNESSLVIWAGSSLGSLVEVGRASDIKGRSAHSKPLVQIRLPQEQKVFTKFLDEGFIFPTVYAEMEVYKRIVESKFESHDGQVTIPILIQLGKEAEYDNVDVKSFVGDRFIDLGIDLD